MLRHVLSVSLNVIRIVVIIVAAVVSLPAIGVGALSALLISDFNECVDREVSVECRSSSDDEAARSSVACRDKRGMASAVDCDSPSVWLIIGFSGLLLLVSLGLWLLAGLLHLIRVITSSAREEAREVSNGR